MLSAVIITKNEEKKIGNCIDSLKKVSSDIVVVDAYSTDTTKQICLSKGVRFFERGWEGYAKAKNFGNQQAKNDWIISLDADECLSDDLVGSITHIFDDATPISDAYELPFITNFCGKWVYHGGWNPEAHIRIFNKNIISWNPDAVHEHLSIKPTHKIKSLKGSVYHYTVDDLESFYAKTDKYSTLFAEKQYLAGKKASFFKIFFSPVFRFIREYFFQFGFLDGKVGFIIASENARYTYLKYKKLQEISMVRTTNA
jgi:glycosyltransferase involved in cell wall biosynthesis